MEHVKIGARERAAVDLIQTGGGKAISEEQMIDMEATTAQYVAEGMTQLKALSGQLSGQGPDPLVELKGKELEEKKIEQRGDQFQQRLQSQEKVTQARIDSAMDRELLKQQSKDQGGQNE